MTTLMAESGVWPVVDPDDVDLDDVQTGGDVRFDYVYSPIKDIRVTTVEDEKTGKMIVDKVFVKDEPLNGSNRFWTSLFSRYGFNKAFFKYFDHAEVFDRISEVEANDRMRICVERGVDHRGNSTNRLMAVSHPTKPVVLYDDLMDTVSTYDGQSIQYANGVVESTHVPRSGGSFDVSGDIHQNRFVLQTPIDGYGQPNIYLSLLRIVCQNGAVAMSKAFRSQLSLGKKDEDTMSCLVRALEGFAHEEGYAAIRDRLQSAAKSWLSVYESERLYSALIKLHTNHHVDVNSTNVVSGTDIAKNIDAAGGSPIITAFRRMTGDPTERYGLANLDALSHKRQRTLPVNCTVYEAINFATEVASHYADTVGARSIQGWVGSTISDEYDMEGTKERFATFDEFLIDSKINAGLTGSKA